MVLIEALIHWTESLVLTLLKQKQNAAWIYITIMITVICLVMENFKANDKNINFPTWFCLGNISEFGATESREESLKENVYGFSVDYNAFDKSGILKIQTCVKLLGLINKFLLCCYILMFLMF